MIKIKKFHCPVCHNDSEIKMYRSVNVDLDKSLREKVLSGKIFSWVCPNCGEELNIHYDFLYHDMSHEFMIYFSPNKCEETNEAINCQLDKYPGMRNSKYRTVDNFNQLIEKILIFESGFDDVTIELAKVLTKHNEDRKIPADCQIVFESYLPNSKVNNKGILMFRLLKNGKIQKEMILLDMAGYNKYEEWIKEDERFKKIRYCENINEKWVLNRMSRKCESE